MASGGTERTEPSMRVVINQVTALGQKAGIGHYTDQLVRCLREQAGAGHIDTFPTGWVRAACETYIRARSALYTGRDNRQTGDRKPPSLLSRLRGRAIEHLY